MTTIDKLLKEVHANKPLWIKEYYQITDTDKLFTMIYKIMIKERYRTKRFVLKVINAVTKRYRKNTIYTYMSTLSTQYAWFKTKVNPFDHREKYYCLRKNAIHPVFKTPMKEFIS